MPGAVISFAFDLVGEHFRLLQEIIGSEKGAVVKTIGDAVVVTFETPDRAIAAAIRGASAK
jgi:class 3 adenylate cyclase